MKTFTALVSALPALALANPLAVNEHNKRAATVTPGKVPEATPTGPFCVPGSTATPPPLTASEIALAVAGCVGVETVGTNDTRNDILDGICKPFTLIFARGTGEDPNLGNIVGPPFVDALDALFGASNVAVQGVNNYPADDIDYCEGGSLTAAADLASLIKQTQTQCPNTKLCVSGYSQGSQVVHNAFEDLNSDPSAIAFVNSVVLYGDPFQKLPINGVPAYKISIDCHVGDNICANGEEVLFPHLTYCHDVAAEALFVKARSLAAN